jgi:hypothetical protein
MLETGGATGTGTGAGTGAGTTLEAGTQEPAVRERSATIIIVETE